MAIAEKTLHVLQASTTNTAGSTLTGNTVDVRQGFGVLVIGKITNGSVSPTDGCEFHVEISGDGVNWEAYSSQLADITANETFSFVVRIPATVMYVRSKFKGNTDESVVVEAEGYELSRIGE